MRYLLPSCLPQLPNILHSPVACAHYTADLLCAHCAVQFDSHCSDLHNFLRAADFLVFTVHQSRLAGGFLWGTNKHTVCLQITPQRLFHYTLYLLSSVIWWCTERCLHSVVTLLGDFKFPGWGSNPMPCIDFYRPLCMWVGCILLLTACRWYFCIDLASFIGC